MAGVRSSKEETERRVFTIQGWIINGVPDYLILKNIQNQFQNKDGNYLSRRQAKVLLQKAYTIWQQDQEATIDQKRALKIARLQQEIRSMDEKYKNTPQGMAVKLSYEKEINKLEALYPVKILRLQGDKENPLLGGDTFDESKERRLQELLEKASKLNV
ncbi:MAG: hypothetical protein RSE15_04850 [Flavobacterium sp.]|uniref:hypothetical protein n=1 Tax=Flavobacterium sp. TaxID=239 RepID=UPI002B485273|nr:hypothetical protein [Flavobacterium sp.]WRH74157.1 MAG: hypothetical protein RSE15_04850 [Flavobacterium sp.]